MAQVKEYDAIIVGSGSGANVVEAAIAQGWKVAWVDKGPLGGTCLNVGCIPSKMLIAPADRIVEIHEAGKLGVRAAVQSIDFSGIMERTNASVAESQRHIREGIEQTENLDFYETECRFVGEYTLDVGKDLIHAPKIYIAAGSRPIVPTISGLDTVDYLDNTSILNLRAAPKSTVIIGGGYIAVEYGHFLAAMGTRVTILELGDRLIAHEEPIISDLLERQLSLRMAIHVQTRAIAIKKNARGVTVVAENTVTGAKREITADSLMIAVGRESNADTLQLQNTGVETDERGWIKVDEYLMTTKPNIWAFGDITGKHMFTHVANRASGIAWHNSTEDHQVPMDVHAIPHAVYSYPQIASVGLTEAKAAEEHDILVGLARYWSTAKGQALMEREGFAKAIVDRTGRILGFHIIGPHAPILIQEVTNAMANDQTVDAVFRGIHIHPALSELIVVTFDRLREPEPSP